MGLNRIWGFLLPDQSMSAVWGSQTVKETCLIEMDSPLEDILDVQAALPAFDGGVTPEPTFTIGWSYHPERSDLILKEAPRVVEHPSAGRPFWLVELVYETASWLDLPLPQENQGPGRIGRNKRISSTTTIKYPWDEPPTWSGGSRSVKATVYRDSNGDLLLHANDLPMLEGIDVDIELEEHHFTWNVEYDTFTYSTDIAPYVGKINSQTVFGASAKAVLLASCTATENYRTQNLSLRDDDLSVTGAVATHHYVTLNATFLIDRRGTTNGYFREANRRVSMHTLQKASVPFGMGTITVYTPIAINSRGDVAQSPWPLTVTGLGYPYSTLPSANPETDFFHIDPLYPEEAALHTFVTNNALAIP